jgi:hypothetical protein
MFGIGVGAETSSRQCCQVIHAQCEFHVTLRMIYSPAAVATQLLTREGSDFNAAQAKMMV